MKYNKQYALLRAKTDTIEHLLCRAQALQEQIKRLQEEKDLDGWYQEQIENAELEHNAVLQLIDIIAK